MNMRIPGALPLLLASGGSMADTVTTSPAATGIGYQLIVSLVIVLAMVAAAAWLLRRMHGTASGSVTGLRIIGGVAVGQRERVVVVEVEDAWLVLGVAPGRVVGLHQLPRPAQAPPVQPAQAGATFVGRITRALERQNRG